MIMKPALTWTRFLRVFPTRKIYYFILIISSIILINKLLAINLILNHGNTVPNKQDLLNIDLSRRIQFQSWQNIGFDESIRDKHFSQKKQIGYVSNLDISKLTSKKSKQRLHNKDNKNDNSNNNNKDNQLYDDHVKFNNVNYDNLVTCSDLEYTSTIDFYVAPENLEVDYINIRNELLTTDSSIAGAFTKKEEEKMSQEEIIKKRWYAFGTAAVWLQSENCYVAYTRIIYSIQNSREYSYISVVSAQAYDKNWNEIKGKRIKYRDVRIPSEVKNHLKRIEKEINHDNCQNIINDNIAYEKCVIRANRETLTLKREREEILDKYSMKYPSVLRVPFDVHEKWNGPEDPHVVLKKDKQGEEPVVIFNMNTHKGRRVHAFMPHRKTESLVDFDIPDFKLRGQEKNWAPFVLPGSVEGSNNSPGYLHLVYDYNPLEILRCSLLTGHCTYIFQAETLDLDKGNTGIIRGGTQYVSLPDLIPQVKGKNIWIGFAKSHINGCGCGSKFYRPVLTVMIEVHGVYHLELLTPNVDFNVEVLGWNLRDTNCGGYNVLSPSSISNWQIISQNPDTKKFEDYLTLTFSEADAISKRVIIRGLLDYILNVYEQKDIKDTFEISEEASSIIQQTSKCAMEEFDMECKRYASTHPNN